MRALHPGLMSVVFCSTVYLTDLEKHLLRCPKALQLQHQQVQSVEGVPQKALSLLSHAKLSVTSL